MAANSYDCSGCEPHICKWQVQSEDWFVTSCDPEMCKDPPKSGQLHCTLCHINVTPSDRHNKCYLIENHVATKTHSDNIRNLKVLPNLPDNKSVFTKRDLMAIHQGGMVFHHYKHNGATKVMDCTSKVMQNTADPSFNCGARKSKMILHNVFAEYADEKLVSDLGKASSISILTDCTSRIKGCNTIKIMAIAGRYFSVDDGLAHRLLDLVTVNGESVDDLVPPIIDVIRKCDIQDRTRILSGDSAPVNFGGMYRNNPPSKQKRVASQKRTYKKKMPEKVPRNIHKQSQAILNRPLFGVACPTHTCNNAIQNAAENLPIPLVEVLGQLYDHFKGSTQRVRQLAAIEAHVSCKELDAIMEFLEKIVPLSHSKTRWLSLCPALERLILMFDTYATYFASKSLDGTKHVKELREFFNNKESLPYLMAIYDLIQIFHGKIKLMEADDITLPRVATEFNGLKSDILHSTNPDDLSPGILRKIESWSVIEKAKFKEEIRKFYTCAHKYLCDWSETSDSWMLGLEELNWIDLFGTLDEEKVIESIKFHFERNDIDIQFDAEQLRQEIPLLNVEIAKYLPMWEKGNKRKRSKKRTFLKSDKRWVSVFQNLSLRTTCPMILEIVSYILSMPPTNAMVERIFSQVNSFWTKARITVPFSTVRAHFMIRYNLTSSCLEMINILKQNEALREAILNDAKYKRKGKTSNGQSSGEPILELVPKSAAVPDSITESISEVAIELSLDSAYQDLRHLFLETVVQQLKESVIESIVDSAFDQEYEKHLCEQALALESTESPSSLCLSSSHDPAVHPNVHLSPVSSSMCDGDFLGPEDSNLSGERRSATHLNSSGDDFCVEQLLVKHGISPNGESIGLKRPRSISMTTPISKSRKLKRASITREDRLKFMNLDHPYCSKSEVSGRRSRVSSHPTVDSIEDFGYFEDENGDIVKIEPNIDVSIVDSDFPSCLTTTIVPSSDPVDDSDIAAINWIYSTYLQENTNTPLKEINYNHQNVQNSKSHRYRSAN